MIKMVQIPYEKLTIEDIIIALSIGDGHIHMQAKAKNAYIDISHSKKQYEYLLWKNNLLIRYGLQSHVTRIAKQCNKKDMEVYRVITKSNGYITNVYKGLYIDKKKNMNYILEHLSPFLLAVWYMDDGSKKVKKKIKRKDGSYIVFKNGYIDSFMIATNGFSFEECDALCDYIRNTFEIIGHIQSDRGTPRISISDNASKIRFKEIISPYVKEIPSMQYKINGIISFKEAMLTDKISG